MKNVFLLTGRPGIGKTTTLTNVIVLLRSWGITVGGVVSCERRVGGLRQGFELRDILSGRISTLAGITGSGPRIGRYIVNVQGLETVGVSALEDSLSAADVTAIDEIGPMELLSKGFLEAIRTVIEHGKPVIGTIHSNFNHPEIDAIRRGPNIEIMWLTYGNRGVIPGEISERVMRLLGRSPPS
jgi:nucleoside-triphosphatase